MFRQLKNNTFIRMISFIGSQAWLYIFSAIGSGACAAVRGILLSLLIKSVIDVAAYKKLGFMNILYYTVLMLGFGILSEVFNYLFNRCTVQIEGNIRLGVFQALEKISIGQWESLHSGEVLSRLNNDVQAMQQAYTWKMTNLLTTIISGISSLITMIVLDWRVGIIAAVINLLMVIINTRFAPTLRKIGENIQKYIGDITGITSDILMGSIVVKMFNIENILFDKFNTKNQEWGKHVIMQSKVNALLEGFELLFRIVSFAGLLAVGLIFVFNHSLKIGSMAAILNLQNPVGFMFLMAGNFINQMQQSLAGAERVFDILDLSAEPERYNASSIGESYESQAMVELKNVTFGYSSEKKVLQDVSMAVYEGQRVAIVGPSGSGKSTIFKLIMGFYPVEQGALYVNKKNIGSYTLPQLRSMIAYVSQDAYLFSGTIEENIRYGRPDATREEVIQAAKLANAHDFIVKLPQGYDTVVGERSTNLSGGERQRIAIARAILKDAPILLLDEATSALDSQSEALVQQALERLMKDRTVLIIAHRFSTIRNADEIFVLRDGKIVERGNHDELMERGGLYRQLYLEQFANMPQVT